MGKYDAVILAGGVTSGELKKIAPYDSEALIIIGSFPMIHYVYKAVKESPSIRNVIISGPLDSLREYFKKDENLIFAPAGEDAVESFAKAVSTVGIDNLTERVLVLPCDIPFITPQAIEDFIRQCEEHEADFHYAIVKKAVNEKQFPGVVRTYAKIKEGVFTGGNLFMVKTAVVFRCIDIGKKLVANRKNPMAIARLFGLRLLLRFLTRRLSIQDAEKRFQEVVGIKGKAIISDYPEVGVDVDKPSDLKLAERILGKRG